MSRCDTALANEIFSVNWSAWHEFNEVTISEVVLIGELMVSASTDTT